ncbi:MAG: hypothetical protein LBB98_01685 [Treponema sp.]|nr:hypothetical protein [Treponema sp.]
MDLTACISVASLALLKPYARLKRKSEKNTFLDKFASFSGKSLFEIFPVL